MTSLPKVKICGLSTPETLQAALDNGARFIGLVFYPKSPRHVSIDTAYELARRVPTGVRSVALFVDPDDALLDQVLSAAPIDIVQLHGAETPQRVQEIKDKYGVQVIKAFRIADADDLRNIESYKDCADWYLFDAKPPNASLPGGTGESFDWSILSGKTWSRPWMLSGGLNEDNIKEALTLLHPDAVDVSSGVESARGIKDTSKIKAFIKTVKDCDKSDD